MESWLRCSLDGVVYSKFWFIPYVYGEQKIVVEATPMDTTFQNAKKLPKYGKIFDKKRKY
jgi:hypothetical protein